MVIVDICIPVYNEQSNIPDLIAQYEAAKQSSCYIGNLILIDNGSSDDTELILNRYRSDEIITSRLPVNIGYGGGMKEALGKSISPFVAIMPANNQYPFSEICSLIDLFCLQFNNASQPHIIKGKRTNRLDPIGIRFLSVTHSIIMSLLIGVYIRDMNGLPKIFDKRFIVENIDRLPNNASFDAALLLEIRRVGLEIIEQPITYLRRKHGHPSWARNRFKTSAKMLLTMLRYRFQR